MGTRSSRTLRDVLTVVLEATNEVLTSSARCICSIYSRRQSKRILCLKSVGGTMTVTLTKPERTEGTSINALFPAPLGPCRMMFLAMSPSVTYWSRLRTVLPRRRMREGRRQP